MSVDIAVWGSCSMFGLSDTPSSYCRIIKFYGSISVICYSKGSGTDWNCSLEVGQGVAGCVVLRACAWASRTARWSAGGWGSGFGEGRAM